MLGRSRLQEFYQRVLREDMLTLFNHTATLRSLECSIVLHGAAAMSEETKYRAACVLEILTGQRITARECNVLFEDPAQRTASDTQRREMERARGALVQQSLLGRRVGAKKNGGPKMDKSVVSEQIRKMGSGFKLKTNLHNVKMYYFLEKCREFYLPDIIGTGTKTEGGPSSETGVGRWRPDTAGHDNDLSKRGLVLQFEKYGGSKRDCYPERYPVLRDENPSQAISCYTLRSTDLLKFPDIELHFEALGPVLGGLRNESEGQALQLILRPALEVTNPLDRESLKSLPSVDKLRIMNYLLSQYFNAYMTRPHIGGLK